MTEQIFSETPRFNHAVQLINQLDGSRFPKLLSRIADKLHIKGEKAFTDDEQDKLKSALNMSSVDVMLLLETLEFILQQAAYYSMKPSALHQHLHSVNMTDDKSQIIVKAWSMYGKNAVEKMRKYSFAPKQLESVDWDMSLQLAQDTKTQMKETNAIFHLNLNNNESGKNEKVLLEFDHGELLQFYNKLEIIQNQLDSLH